MRGDGNSSPAVRRNVGHPIDHLAKKHHQKVPIALHVLARVLRCVEPLDGHVRSLCELGARLLVDEPEPLHHQLGTFGPVGRRVQRLEQNPRKMRKGRLAGNASEMHHAVDVRLRPSRVLM